MEEVEPRDDGPHEEQLEQVMLVEETVNVCPVCLKNVKSRTFKRHKLKCEGNLPPPCNLCGKQLNRHDHLQRHMKDRCTR